MSDFVEKLLKDKGITADNIASGKLTEKQCYDLINLAEIVDRKRHYSIESRSGYRDVYYDTYIISFDNRYFSLTKKCISDSMYDYVEVFYSDIYEVEKYEYEKTIIETKWERKNEINKRT